MGTQVWPLGSSSSFNQETMEGGRQGGCPNLSRAPHERPGASLCQEAHAKGTWDGGRGLLGGLLWSQGSRAGLSWAPGMGAEPRLGDSGRRGQPGEGLHLWGCVCTRKSLYTRMCVCIGVWGPCTGRVFL